MALALLATSPAHARPAPTPATVTTCFTAPGAPGHCAARIAAEIDQAKATVLVQAYADYWRARQAVSEAVR